MTLAGTVIAIHKINTDLIRATLVEGTRLKGYPYTLRHTAVEERCLVETKRSCWAGHRHALINVLANSIIIFKSRNTRAFNRRVRIRLAVVANVTWIAGALTFVAIPAAITVSTGCAGIIQASRSSHSINCSPNDVQLLDGTMEKRLRSHKAAADKKGGHQFILPSYKQQVSKLPAKIGLWSYVLLARISMNRSQRALDQ
jgi:hypothetical protein